MEYQLKDSGVEWLGEIPEHWAASRIKYCAVIRGGFAFPSSEYKDEGIPLIRISNTYLSRLDLTRQPVFLDESYLDTHKSFSIKKGDILMSLTGTLGKRDYGFVIQINLDGIFLLNQRVAKLETNWKVLDRYFIYALQSEAFLAPIYSLPVGTKQANLSNEDIVNQSIPLPPKQEQIAIAEYLDQATEKIDQTIATKEAQLDTLTQYRKSLIQEKVTKGLTPNPALKDSGVEWLGKIPEHWEVKRVKSLVSKVNSGVTPKGGSKAYLDEGVPLIRSQNILDGSFSLSDAVFIDEATHLKMANSHVRENDVLLNITGASLGRSAVFNSDTVVNVNQHVCIIRPHSWRSPQYLNYLLIADVGQSQIFSSFTGSGREGLSFESIKRFICPLPPKEEQIAIAEYLDEATEKIDSTSQNLRDQIDTLKKYRKSLIHEVVTGRKRVYHKDLTSTSHAE